METKKEFEFFVYGCEKHVSEFVTGAKGTYEILDSVRLKDTDVNYGKDCAFELATDGISDSFVLIKLEVLK